MSGLSSRDVCGPFDPSKAAVPLGPHERAYCPWPGCHKPRLDTRRECYACERMAQRNGREDGGRPVRRRKVTT